jgi:hypothetical protein
MKGIAEAMEEAGKSPVILRYKWMIGNTECLEKPEHWEEGSSGRTLWVGLIPCGRVTSNGVWWEVAMYLAGRPKENMTYRHPEIAKKKAERYARLWAKHFLVGAKLKCDEVTE